jgi:hypothetical protein
MPDTDAQFPDTLTSMGQGRQRRGPVWATAGLVVAMTCVLYAVWRSPHRDDLATYGAFAVAVFAAVPGLSAWVRRRSSGKTAGSEDLDRIVGFLAVAVRAQWEKAAIERELDGTDPIQITWASPSQAMAGPTAVAAGSRRFAPLPGLLPTAAEQLASGRLGDLHAVYGGLGSGRLIITGGPGAGKSGAAVLLILAALRYRDQAPAGDRAKIPVPVLFTAQDWNPSTEPVADWLTRQLGAAYPPFFGAAGAVLASDVIAGGWISVIIDGLDEIAEEARPIALQALSQQAVFRIVVLSRTSEMASAASRRGILHGAAAIELQPVSPAEAVSYLERAQLDPPPTGWRDLTDSLRASPEGALSRALDNPLALTLVRDTCQTGDDARDLLAFCATLNDMPDGEDARGGITDYLLDRVLLTAYARQPGQAPLPFDLPAAQNALAKIAACMNHENTRDLYWWHIPAWVPRAQRRRMGGLAFGLAFGIASGLAGGLVGGLGVQLGGGFMIGLGGGLVSGLKGGLAFGLVAGWAAGLVVGFASGGTGAPGRTTKLKVKKALDRKTLLMGLAGFALGLGFGLAEGLVVGLETGLAIGSIYGLVIGVTAWTAAGLRSAATAEADTISSLSPATSWQLNRNYVLTVTLMVGLVLTLLLGLVSGLTFGVVHGLAGALVLGPPAGLAIGLVIGLSSCETWPTFLASVQMAREWHTPVPLMRFLNDAHSRNVLRTVGPAYQFRHARLQDRLAAMPDANNPAQTSEAAEPSPAAARQQESTATTPVKASQEGPTPTT